MTLTKAMLTMLASGVSAVLIASTPVVSEVEMTQPEGTRLVTVRYSLSGAAAVVTLDIQTNANTRASSDDPGWTSIGGDAIWNAMGDVWKKVECGEAGAKKTITWRPDHSWPNHTVPEGGARAVVTAWSLDNPPDYMVVDLAAANAVHYYPSVAFLPGATIGQKGAVTNNPLYKTSKLVLRKIMARGIVWAMGSGAGETQRNLGMSETPHEVTLSENYYMGVFEVTQGQWANVKVSSTAVAKYAGLMRPMESVSYNEIRNAANDSHASHAATDWPNAPHAQSFLGLLRAKTGLDFDLPSEAQWEFAARAGHGTGCWNNGTRVLNTDVDGNLADLGCYKGNSSGETVAVGSYAPNTWGLYDMHGNVYEWCLDWKEDDITGFNGAVNIDPTDSTKSLSGAVFTGEWVMARMYRGGSFSSNAANCRSGFRGQNAEWFNQKDLGFRIVCPVGVR